MGPPQRKDHCTRPQRPPPLRNLQEEGVEGGIHQRPALPQVVAGVVCLKLRRYQADNKLHLMQSSIFLI